MDARPARVVMLCLAKHLAGYWRDIPVPTMRDLGDVCGARNTQFEQEFLGLFRAETVSAYDWRDRIGDFCVADLADAFEVSRVCDDAREFLELIELIQLRASFLFTAINSAHRLWPTVSTTRLQTAIDRAGEGLSDGNGNGQPLKGHYRL